MSIQDKLKALKKKPIQVKGAVHLDEKQTAALNELMEIVGIKELLTIALDEPKNLLSALKKQRKIATTFNQKVELSAVDNDTIKGYLDEGFSMDEILSVAFSRLNVVKSLNEIKRDEESE